jgi:hypothetical protein
MALGSGNFAHGLQPRKVTCKVMQENYRYYAMQSLYRFVSYHAPGPARLRHVYNRSLKRQ